MCVGAAQARNKMVQVSLTENLGAGGLNFEQLFHFSVSGTMLPLVSPARCFLKLREKIISLIIYYNKGGEVLNGDFENRFHDELGVFEGFDAGDAVAAQAGGGAADGA